MADREAIIAACREMNAAGLNQGTSGNISLRQRDSGGDAMLITPSATPYDAMTPEMIARMPLDGSERWEGPRKPSSEWRFHRDILRARPEIAAVVHAHAPHATALAMARRAIPACHYMVAAFGGNSVRCCDYALFGTQALSDLVLEALQDRTACLMANHGDDRARGDARQGDVAGGGAGDPGAAVSAEPAAWAAYSERCGNFRGFAGLCGLWAQRLSRPLGGWRRPPASALPRMVGRETWGQRSPAGLSMRPNHSTGFHYSSTLAILQVMVSTTSRWTWNRQCCETSLTEQPV